MRHLGIRWRYALSFFLVLIIPLATFSLYNFYFFNNKLKEQVVSSNLGSLNTLQNFMDMQLSQMQAIATQISVDSDYRPFQLLTNPMRAYTMLNKLRTLLLSNSFINQLMIVYKDDDYFYTANGSYTKSSFEQSYKFLNYDGKALIEDLYGLDKPSVYPVGEIMIASATEPVNSIIFAYPLWYSNQGSLSFGSLAMLIDTTDIDQIIQEKIGSSHSVFLMISPEGHLDYGSNTQVQLDMPGLLDKLQRLAPMEVGEYESQGVSYLIASSHSDSTEYQYGMMIPTDQIMKPVENVRFIAVAVGMGALLVGLAFIVLLVIYNYDPIKKLQQTMGLDGVDLETRLNELDHIRLHMVNLLAAKQNLESESRSNETAVRQYFLYRILRGEITNITSETIPLSIRRCLQSVNFRIAILEISGLQQLPYDPKNMIVEEVERNLHGPEQAIAMLDMEGRRIIVLILDSHAWPELHHTFTGLIDQINQQQALSATVGLGCEYPGLTDVRKSFLEASAALDYRLVGGEQRVFYFPELFAKNVNFRSLYDQLGRRLEYAVLQGQSDQSEDIIRELIQSITDQHMPLFAARLFLHDVINTLTHLVAQRYGSSYLAYDLDIYGIERMTNIRDLAEAIRLTVDKLCHTVKDYLENGHEEQRKFQDYLLQHAFLDDFSVSGMASDFGCSQPSLNQRFKISMETTIWDAVVTLRIERAKQLLSETSMTLQEIVSLIGYRDVSIFVRKFRIATGKTPGEYRMLYTLPR